MRDCRLRLQRDQRLHRESCGRDLQFTHQDCAKIRCKMTVHGVDPALHIQSQFEAGNSCRRRHVIAIKLRVSQWICCESCRHSRATQLIAREARLASCQQCKTGQKNSSTESWCTVVQMMRGRDHRDCPVADCGTGRSGFVPRDGLLADDGLLPELV